MRLQARIHERTFRRTYRTSHTRYCLWFRSNLCSRSLSSNSHIRNRFDWASRFCAHLNTLPARIRKPQWNDKAERKKINQRGRLHLSEKCKCNRKVTIHVLVCWFFSQEFSYEMRYANKLLHLHVHWTNCYTQRKLKQQQQQQQQLEMTMK